MIDVTHDPRNEKPKDTKESINRLEALIDTALEHASHGWSAFERETTVNRINEGLWPPQVRAPVGSAQYHLSATIMYVFEAYQIIRTEQDRMNGIESPNNPKV